VRSFVIVFPVVDVDNESISWTTLTAEVLSHQTVDVIVLTGFFTTDCNTWITLGKAWFQNVAVFHLLFEADDTTFIRNSVTLGGCAFLKVQFLPLLTGKEFHFRWF